MFRNNNKINKIKVRHPEKVNKPDNFQIKKPSWLKVKCRIQKGILKQKKLLTFIMFTQFAKRLLVQILVLAGRKNMQLL